MRDLNGQITLYKLVNRKNREQIILSPALRINLEGQSS
jgi:hypothetical protein